jgi:hypothetical protein
VLMMVSSQTLPVTRRFVLTPGRRARDCPGLLPGLSSSPQAFGLPPARPTSDRDNPPRPQALETRIVVIAHAYEK